jgi:tRNA (adenine22-N1)-methyltransferase
MTLSKRLSQIVSYISAGSRVADVGTDHGYIPIWLVENGICPHVVATDVRQGPLERAVENARRCGVSDKISFSLCFGLNSCAPEDVDTVVISGMGGETIIEILHAAPWSKEKTLIIQPQSKIAELRTWMNENGYAVIDASLVEDAGRIYVVWKCTAGEKSALQPHELFVDSALMCWGGALLPEYIDDTVKKLQRRCDGLEIAACADAQELGFCRAAIDGLLKIRKEITDA